MSSLGLTKIVSFRFPDRLYILDTDSKHFSGITNRKCSVRLEKPRKNTCQPSRFPDFKPLKKSPNGTPILFKFFIGVPITFLNIRFQNFFVSLLSYAAMFVFVERLQARVVITV